MKSGRFLLIFFLVCLVAGTSCTKKTDSGSSGVLQLAWAKVGSTTLVFQGENKDVAADSTITLSFNGQLDTNSAKSGITLKKAGLTQAVRFAWGNDRHVAVMKLGQPLDYLTGYTLQLGSGIRSSSGDAFPGVEYGFTTLAGSMKIDQVTLNGVDFKNPALPKKVGFKSLTIQVKFTRPVDTAGYKSCFVLSGSIPFLYAVSADQKTVTLQNTKQLADVTKYTFDITNTLKSKDGYSFDGFLNSFYTALDSVPKFPVISDDALLTLIQQKTFSYFYDFGHPVSGMARERNSSGDVVTTGGSGFGIMALIVGMNRNFITRGDGLARLGKILNFLETCDRYHGAWPHWINGATGKTVPFTTEDDGADLVETSYMVQGLITMRQYLDAMVPAEKTLADRINVLLGGVEYDWFTRGQNVLYWHWSPDYGWAMNMPIRGYNETLITYVVAATSTTHPILPAVYHQGYAQNGAIKNGNTYFGYVLPLGNGYGGPLFFTHYSFLGLNPKTLQDTYANYSQQNVNQSLINWSYCAQNPRNWVEYSTACWGLTASDNPWGYNAQSPDNDLGVITPTAAISALPYTPEQSMKAIHLFYYQLGNRLWNQYGFYDAFDLTEGWYADSSLAIDEGPIICMIENYRSGLLWNLFMSAPEVSTGLTKLGFTY